MSLVVVNPTSSGERSVSPLPAMKRAEYATMAAVERDHWWYRSLHRIVAQHLPAAAAAAAGRRILDAGCGTGGTWMAVAASDDVYIGFDRSPDAVAFCRGRGFGRSFLADVASIPAADASVQAVLSLDVFCYAGLDQAAILRQLFNAMSPGGVLLLNLPAFDTLRGRHDAAVGISRRFRRPEVRALLEVAGFEIVKLSYWNTTLFLPLMLWRWISRRTPSDEATSDSQLPAPWINALLERLLRVEVALLGHVNLPFGSSVFAVARRRSD